MITWNEKKIADNIGALTEIIRDEMGSHDICRINFGKSSCFLVSINFDVWMIPISKDLRKQDYNNVGHFVDSMLKYSLINNIPIEVNTAE